MVYASWNGATNVSSWEVSAGSKHDKLRPLGIAKRHGFETAIPLRIQPRFASVTAVDYSGRRMRRSPVIQL